MRELSPPIGRVPHLPMTTFRQLLDEQGSALHFPPRPLEPGECQSSTGLKCHLCHAGKRTYAEELQAKVAALALFWKMHIPGVPLAPLLSSPQGREYRTASKRKAFTVRGSTRLGLIDPERESDQGRVEVQRCAIEPREHAAIYSFLQSALDKPHGAPLTRSLRHAVIKGSYREFILILTVAEITPAIVKATNTVSKGLTRRQKDIVGVYLYEDQSRGGYYLGMKDQESPGKMLRVFGKKEIYHRVGEKVFMFSPLSFSQINHSQLETITGVAARLLSPDRPSVLYDLYCGYGLFSLMLAKEYRTVVGVEVGADSIDSARANAHRQGITHARFLRSNITAAGVLSVMHEATSKSRVLLDPPRKGTAPGVIEAIASKRPERVLHIFCNIEVIADELKRWSSCGYRPTSAVPIDMFPGTAVLEVLVCLSPSQ